MAKSNTASKVTQQMNRVLVQRLMAIVGMIIVLVLAVGFFAPQVGSFFGLFSKNRNKPEEHVVIKPNAPIFSSMPKATKENSININGYNQPGLTVKLFVNGPEVDKITVNADGLFTFNGVKLNDGQNTIFAKAIDGANVESDPTMIFHIYVDKEKPKLDITSPKEGENIKNLDKRISINGKVSEKAQVKVNGKVAIVKPDLTFEYQLGVSNEGNVKISIVATDEAGNENKKEFSVNYQKESF